MDRNNKIIGLTGGIGTGKSVVAQVLRTMGFFVYDSDEQAKNLVNTNEQLKLEIIDLLGSQAFNDQGYNKPWVAQQVFGNASLLKSLNDIIHPKVSQHFDQWVLQHKQAQFLFKETALLFELGLEKHLDYTVLVTAPIATRITRVQKRSGFTKEEIEQRIQKQINPERASALADYVICNDGQTAVLPQVIKLLSDLENKWS